MDEKKTVVLDFQVDTKGAVVSIENLTKANKELRDERKKLDLSTQDGVNRAEEINKSLDKNTELIKANSSALEKQRLNVGNYTESINKAAGGIRIFGVDIGSMAGKLSETTETVKKMTTAQKLLLGPIGLLIAAFGILATAFEKSGALGDKLEQVFDGVKTVIDVLVNRIVKMGEAMVLVFQGKFTEAGAKAKEAVTGVGDAIKKAFENGQELRKQLQGIEDDTNTFILTEGKRRNEIEKLILQSKNRGLAEEDRIKILNKASDLENKITKDQIELTKRKAQNDIEQIAKTKEMYIKAGESVIEFANRVIETGDLGATINKKIAESVRSIDDAETDSIKILEKIQNDREKLQIAQALSAKKRNDDLRKDRENQEKLALGFTASIESQHTDIVKENEALRAGFRKATGDKNVGITKAEYNAAVKSETDQTKIAKLEQQARINNALLTANAVVGLFQQGTDAYKIATLAKLSIDTSAAIGALTAASEENPANAFTFGGAGALQFALGLVRITANIGQAIDILSSFSEGGYTGPGGKYQPAGIVHAGEVVWNQSDVAAVGGPGKANAMRPTYSDGGIVANSMTRGMSQSSMPNIEVNLGFKEFNEFKNKVNFKESLTTA